MRQRTSAEPPSSPSCTEPHAAPDLGTRTKASRCPCCGRRAVQPTAQPGRVCRYRNAALTLPAELRIPTCRRCKHQILSLEAVPALATVLEATYRAELVRRAAAEIARLARFYSQRQTEVILDLSQGYLSRLRAGDGVPSAALVSLLALLSAEPSRMEELKGYWALPHAPEPQVPPRKSRP